MNAFDFDYDIHPDDFVFYELGRLIDEDRADLRDNDFRRLIEEGLREHVERRTDVRAGLAAMLKTAGRQDRIIRIIEDPEAPLRAVEPVVRSYMSYLLRRLEDTPAGAITLENEARDLIERWQHGEVLREQLANRLTQICPPAISPVADLLFEFPGDRIAAETAVEVLGSSPSPTAARILAHAISEPMLDEDLELKVYDHLRSVWPLPRLFVLYSLRSHAHEDLPVRWFQLLVEVEEPEAVDRIIEEVVIHAENFSFHEDLQAVLELLSQAKDPDKEDKVLQILNSPEAARSSVKMLEQVLRTL